MASIINKLPNDTSAASDTWLVSCTKHLKRALRHTPLICAALIFQTAYAQQTIEILGTGVGEIPDNNPEAPLQISFDAPAVQRISDLQISVTMTHTWVGDLTLTLVAPGADEHTLFARTGLTVEPGFGDNSNLDGAYIFSDTLTTSNNWWAVAADLNSSQIIPPGNYRTTLSGPSPEGGVETVILDSFESAYPAGTWRLLISDSSGGDLGEVAAAALGISTEAITCSPEPCLTTSLDHNNSSQGIFLDISAKDKDIIVTAIDFFATNSDGDYQIYTKRGSYIGFEADATPWTAGPIRSISNPDTELNNYSTTNVIIRAGQTVGFLLGADQSDGGFNEVLNISESAFVETKNSDIAISSGAGVQILGSVGSAFDGALLSQNRSFVGTIVYKIDEQSCYVTVAKNGNVVNFCL